MYLVVLNVFWKSSCDSQQLMDLYRNNWNTTRLLWGFGEHHKLFHIDLVIPPVMWPVSLWLFLINTNTHIISISNHVQKLPSKSWDYYSHKPIFICICISIQLGWHVGTPMAFNFSLITPLVVSQRPNFTAKGSSWSGVWFNSISSQDGINVLLIEPLLHQIKVSADG